MEAVKGHMNKLPLLVVCARVFALYHAYSLLMRDGVQPLFFTLIALIVTVLVQLGSGVLRAQLVTSLSFRSMSVVFLLGAWAAINHVMLFTSLAKLHPFRFAVGEHFEILITLALAAHRSNDIDGSSHLRRNAFILIVGALVCLGWASNLYNYVPATAADGGDGSVAAPKPASSEDLTSMMDSVGGMLLLSGYVVSEYLRKRIRTMSVVDMDDDLVEVIAPAVGVAVFFPLVVLMSAFDNLTSGSVSWLGVVVCGFILCGLPSFPIVSHARRRHHLAPHVAIGVVSVVAFFLHVTYHNHYSDGAPLNDTHPAMHTDNLLMIVCGMMMVGGAWLLSTDTVSSLDETSLLFTGADTAAPTSLLEDILENSKERKLFLFFCLTLFFMLVELIYGIHVNSLGLISDSFHMLLDSASLAIGLWAAHMAKWKPNASHPFGYGRYEILSGFTNGVLLLFIGGYIFAEAMGRMFEPPEIEQNYLLGVSLLGLLINIAGLVIFHSDGHGKCGGHGHAHDHGGHSHAHAHGGGGDGGEDMNLRAVYLHILADFLGSVSVIISSIIVSTTGWMVADPICSAFISCLIFMAALPLLQATSEVLLQRSPRAVAVNQLRAQMERLDQVAAVGAMHIWVQATTPEPIYVVNATVTAAGGCKSAQVREQVLMVLRSNGISSQSHVSIQVSSSSAS